MVRLLLLLVLAFPLALLLTPTLSFVAIDILNLDAIDPSIFVPDLAAWSENEQIGLVFWTLIIWLILSFGHVPFGFIRPRVSRFSDTKPLRYFQSIFFEIIVLALSVVVIGWVMGVGVNYYTARNADTAQDREQLRAEISRKYASDIRRPLWEGLGSLRALVYVDQTHIGWQKQLGQLSFDIPEECKNELERFYAPEPSEPKSAAELALSGIDLSTFEIFTDDGPLGYTQCRFYGEANRLHPIVNAEVDEELVRRQEERRENLFNGRDAAAKILEDTPGRFIAGILIGHLFLRAGVQAFITSSLCLMFISFLDASKRGYGGAGRFTGLFEEMASSFFQKDDEIFLGRSLFNPFVKIGIRDDRHMLTIGGSRGGKGVSAIIPNLLKWKGSAIVIDPKGTNAAVTARFRREKLRQNVYVIDPFGESKIDDVSYFDPLSQFSPDDSDAREKVMLVADALIVQAEGTRDPHWDEKSVTILAGFIAHLMTDPTYETRRTLPELRKMVNMSGDVRLRLFADMQNNMSFGELPHQVANSIENMGDSAEFKSIMSSMEKHTEWMSSPAMIEVMSQASFNFSDLKTQGTTVYLVIPPQYLKTHARFIRLFINLTIRGFVEGGRSRIPTLMIMDEFLSLERMKEVENAMSWAAGYNLLFWPFVQQFGTFKELYGESVDAFISNCRAVQVFAVNGQPTKEFVSENLGKRPLQSLLNVTRSNETLSLRESSEVDKDVSAESGRQYIIQTGKPTMLIERVPYFKSFFFNGYDPDPDHPKPVSWWQKQW